TARDIVEDNGSILHHENIASSEKGYYVEAKDLKVGDTFLDANGELSTLAFTERVEFPEGITVYNFTVADNHNYFVIAKTDNFGQTCILVHNAGKNYYHQLSAEHIHAAKIEKNGGIVGINPKNGKSWDPLQEVRDAMKGITAEIIKIKAKLSYPYLSVTDRISLEKQLSDFSIMRDRVRRILGE
ncbi:MAG: hypothetical protein LBE18_05360, partial [Planctomycetaceae bacterium]|nr:hypothetical protein [Planctomycetaceae bacterium]